jgi:hypothetical protein
MSNTRRPREIHGGHFSRPRDQWTHKLRDRSGRARSGPAVGGGTTLASLMRWRPPGLHLPGRAGDR